MQKNEINLTGRHAIVTGAAQGIGFAVASRLLASGATIALWDRDAEELAAEMLATTLDVDFDPDKSWDEKKEIYRISNKIVRTANVTQSAVGDKNGRWTTTIAAAILLFDDQ